MSRATTGTAPGPDASEALIAFDALPEALRRRLANATVQVDPTDLVEWYRRARRSGAPLDDIVDMAEQSIQQVEAEARREIEAQQRRDAVKPLVSAKSFSVRRR